ncbi:MAG: hypothetical protein HOD60_11095, partial [Candidatus Nitrosopelagicus sp.]|nr:hypothetical protein [Candidatus Nitrosopelagicus sp.]
MKSVFLIAIVAVAMIGMMVPSAFAYTITDDATGGDCSTIGTWDSASRTCTLSDDISEQIVIGANNIVLDGNGKTILGNPNQNYNEINYHDANYYYCYDGETAGIQLNAKTNIVIKNIVIKNWCHGILAQDSINNSFQENTIIENYWGIRLTDSIGDSIEQNNFIDIQKYAIWFEGSDFSITDNSIDDQSNYLTHSENYVGFRNPTSIGMVIDVMNSGENIIENNTFGSPNTGFLRGIQLGSNYFTTTIKNNDIWNMAENGISCGNSCDIFENNLIITDIQLVSDIPSAIIAGSYTSFHNNLIDNWHTAISSSGNTFLIYDNLIQNNLNTFRMSSGGQNIVQNNLINNNSPGSAPGAIFDTMNSVSWTNSPNIVNTGNYWSDHSPLCTDTNNDNFCDNSYPFSGGSINIVDDYVWKVQNGWKTTINTPSDSTVNAVDSSGLSHNYSVSATHDGTSMSVSCDHVSGSTFPIGVTDVLCTANNGIHSTFSVTVNPPPPAISSTSPPTESNTTVEGNNLDLKIFATGNVQYLIDGITTVSTTWKDPNGTTVYQANLQIDASGNFNNEFDNPMYVRDMKDSGLYTTTVTYDDVTAQYTWNYLSTVYAAQQAAAQAVIDAAAAEAAAQQAAVDAAAAEAAAAAQAAVDLASQPVSTNTITTVDESGFSQSCVDTGCYVPLTAVVNYGDTVTMTNTDPTGVHTFTSGTVNGFTPSP